MHNTHNVTVHKLYTVPHLFPRSPQVADERQWFRSWNSLNGEDMKRPRAVPRPNQNLPIQHVPALVCYGTK